VERFKLGGVEVTHLTHDSRTVREGSCFFAIDGGKESGAKYITQAIAKGAVLVIAQKDAEIEKPAVPVLYVDDVRESMSLAAKRFYGDICDKMTIVGVTGTNGKTTCSYILRHLLSNKKGYKDIGIVGTLGAFVGEECLEYGLTTPDPILLHETFAKMYKMGVRTVAMEVTAHAIHLKKIAGIGFRVGMFTNLSQDHLDFFGTMEKYGNTKTGWVSGKSVQRPISNADDEYGQHIIGARQDALSYSLSGVTDLRFDGQYTSFKIGKKKYKTTMSGNFNVSNILCCMAAAKELGISDRQIRSRVKTIPQIPGRFNVFRAKRGFNIVVDFAHTPDSLEKILGASRGLCGKNGRLISVFGCGGDRDKTKREIMGKVSGEHADFTIITSDNPRSESPEVIMAQIEVGVRCVSEDSDDETKSFKIVLDRSEATRVAFDMAKKGDVVVIAGKGAETTQEINGVFHPYNDIEVVRNYIQGK